MESNNDQDAAITIHNKYPKILASAPTIKESDENGLFVLDMDLNSPLYNSYYEGTAICHSPTSGPLREYYNGLIAMTRDRRFRHYNAKSKVYRRISDTLRLLYFDTLKVQLATNYKHIFEKGYNSPRGRRIGKKIDMAKASRKQTLQYTGALVALKNIDEKSKKAPTEDFNKLTVMLNFAMWELDPYFLRDEWLPYQELSVFPGRKSPPLQG